jgi:hypothetical protein
MLSLSSFGIILLFAAQNAPESALSAAAVTRFAELALECVHKEYPNKISHVLNSDADVRPPRELTPVFCGCYDWHSAVHGHWLLVRLCRKYPQADFVPRARAALAESFAPEKVAAEVEYLPQELRTTLWVGVAAPAFVGAARVGRSAGPGVGSHAGTSRRAGGRALY